MIQTIIASVIAYLIGSIPTAYIFGKAIKNIDIREHGSGNMGATNAMRVLGKQIGLIVLALDILKGVIATTVVVYVFHLQDLGSQLILGVMAIIGHNWTCFLKFKGGKGVATTLGVLIGYTITIAALRMVVLLTVGVWIVSFLLSGFVSLSSVLAAISLPIWMVLTNQSFPLICVGIIFCVFVVFRHKPNIRRLFEGKESRVQLFKKKDYIDR